MEDVKVLFKEFNKTVSLNKMFLIKFLNKDFKTIGAVVQVSAAFASKKKKNIYIYIYMLHVYIYVYAITKQIKICYLF